MRLVESEEDKQRSVTSATMGARCVALELTYRDLERLLECDNAEEIRRRLGTLLTRFVPTSTEDTINGNEY